MQRKNVKNLVTAGLCLALGVAMPTLFHMVGLGSAFLPMHIPVLFCGLLCGWQYGLAVGFAAPLLRSVLFGMPPMYPVAISMAFELAAYGLIIALVYARLPRRGVGAVYGALLAAMVGGRLVWGLAEILLLGLAGNAFTAQAFLSGALLSAVPGILLQLVLIPGVMAALDRTGVVPFGAAQG